MFGTEVHAYRKRAQQYGFLEPGGGDRGRGAPFRYRCGGDCGGGSQCNEGERRVRTASCKPFVAPEAATAAVLHFNGKIKPWKLFRDDVRRGADKLMRYSQCATTPAGAPAAAGSDADDGNRGAGPRRYRRCAELWMDYCTLPLCTATMSPRLRAMAAKKKFDPYAQVRAAGADRGAAWERYCAPATCLPDASCACERARHENVCKGAANAFFKRVRAEGAWRADGTRQRLAAYRCPAWAHEAAKAEKKMRDEGSL